MPADSTAPIARVSSTRPAAAVDVEAGAKAPAAGEASRTGGRGRLRWLGRGWPGPGLWPGSRSPRREPAVLFALPVAAFGYYYATADAAPWSYAVDRAASAHDAIIAVAPFVAATAAWEMTTLRRLWGRIPVRRSWWRVLADRLAVPVSTALLIMAAVYVLLFADLPEPAAPGWEIPLLSVACVLGWALFGAAAGLVAGPVLALPVSLIAPFVTMAIPGGWSDPLWARHATGLVNGCCDPGSVFDPRALRASLTLLTVIAVVALCMACVRLAPAGAGSARLLIALVLIAGSVAGGLTAARDVRELGADAAAARPSTDLDCPHPTVCLWPEDRADLDVNVEAWERVRGAWIGLGLPAPPPAIGPGGSDSPLPIAVRMATVEQAEASMAVSLPIAMRGCTGHVTAGTDVERARFGDLIVLLAERLAVRTLARPSHQPLTADEAPAIWAATTPCAR